MPRENCGAFLRSLGRIFNDGSASAVEMTDGVFWATILAKLSPTALLGAAVAVMLAVGTMLTMDLTNSTARGFGRAIIAKPDGTVVTGRVLDGDGRPIAGASRPRIRSRKSALLRDDDRGRRRPFHLRGRPGERADHHRPGQGACARPLKTDDRTGPPAHRLPARTAPIDPRAGRRRS